MQESPSKNYPLRYSERIGKLLESRAEKYKIEETTIVQNAILSYVRHEPLMNLEKYKKKWRKEKNNYGQKSIRIKNRRFKEIAKVGTPSVALRWIIEWYCAKDKRKKLPENKPKEFKLIKKELELFDNFNLLNQGYKKDPKERAEEWFEKMESKGIIIDATRIAELIEEVEAELSIVLEQYYKEGI